MCVAVFVAKLYFTLVCWLAGVPLSRVACSPLCLEPTFSEKSWSGVDSRLHRARCLRSLSRCSPSAISRRERTITICRIWYELQHMTAALSRFCLFPLCHGCVFCVPNCRHPHALDPQPVRSTQEKFKDEYPKSRRAVIPFLF